MKKELLNMKICQNYDKSHFDYNEFIKVKSILNGKWYSTFGKGILIVRRIK